MTILTVALKYLRGRLVASTLTAVSIALGVSLVVASVLLAGGIKAGFIAGATDYNLVVGAKGSPTQLVLSVVFRMDLATPNIEYTAYRDLQQDPRVETAVPIAVGDAYRGFRYVATKVSCSRRKVLLRLLPRRTSLPPVKQKRSCGSAGGPMKH